MKKIILVFAAISSFCILSNISYAQSWVWGKSAGGTGLEWASSVATDTLGNIYMAGWFYSTSLIFGSTTLTNAGGSDIFIVKYNNNGDILWAKSVGGTAGEGTYSVAVDASGNVYLAGGFSSPALTIGSFTLTNEGSSDIFLAKFDVNGNVLWAKSAGGTNGEVAFSIAVDASGNTNMAGYYYSPAITFGYSTLTNAGSWDIFLAKYDTDGNVLLAKSIGGTGDEWAYSVAVDTSGNTYLAGIFADSALSFGNTTLTNAGAYDLFLAKYDANGNVLWAKSAGGTSEERTYSVAVDASGNIYLAGMFISPTLTFGSTTLTSAGWYDIFLAKYDTNGNVLWAKRAGGTDYDQATSVDVDASGNIYIAGSFNSPTLTFGSAILTTNGGYDTFLAKYDASGNVLWAKSAGGMGDELTNTLVVDASGSIYLAGCFYSPTLTCGSTTLINAGDGDIFVVKFGSVTGLNESVNSENIAVFPNPSADEINIIIHCLSCWQGKNATIEILNFQGQTLETIISAGNQININISNLAKGMYFIKVTNDKEIITKKFIKE